MMISSIRYVGQRNMGICCVRGCVCITVHEAITDSRDTHSCLDLRSSALVFNFSAFSFSSFSLFSLFSLSSFSFLSFLSFSFSSFSLRASSFFFSFAALASERCLSLSARWCCLSSSFIWKTKCSEIHFFAPQNTTLQLR